MLDQWPWQSLIGESLFNSVQFESEAESDWQCFQMKAVKLVFIDDILVFSKVAAEHKLRLDAVMAVLHKIPHVCGVEMNWLIRVISFVKIFREYETRYTFPNCLRDVLQCLKHYSSNTFYGFISP